MLIYEVNLEVPEDIKQQIAGWLAGHIPEMLKFKGFKAAHWYFRLAEDEETKLEDKTLWTIHYLVEDRPSLDQYLKDKAPAIRQEARERFGDKFTISRRILNLLSVAASPEILAAAATPGEQK